MAGPPPAALLLGVAAAFFLMRKKGEPTEHPDLPSLDGDGKPSIDQGKIPSVKSQEELLAELEAETEATKAQVRAGLQWKLLPSGYDIPNDMGHNEIWVSEDCEAAVVGRDWTPILNYKDKLWSPASFWDEFADGDRPNEPTGSNDGSSAAAFYTTSVIDQNNENFDCMEKLPNPSEFDDNQEYGDAWTDLRNSAPGLAELYDFIYSELVGGPMMAAWQNADPQAWFDYQVLRVAKWAHLNYASMSVTDQTDEAYKLFNDQIGDLSGEGITAPAVLDPDNPDHEVYVQLWLDLRDAIQAL